MSRYRQARVVDDEDELRQLRAEAEWLDATEGGFNLTTWVVPHRYGA